MQPSKPLIFSQAEIHTMNASAPGVWWRAFIALTLDTGLRVQEILRLHVSDVDQGSRSVRITADPVDGTGDPPSPSLRVWLPPQRERSVPINPETLGLLNQLREDRQNDSHVFVPDWKLDQLWTWLASSESLRTEMLCPQMSAWFQMIQRRARAQLARTRAVPLSNLAWPKRGLSALRATAMVRLAQHMTPRELAEHLGLASTKCVAPFYEGVRSVREHAA